MALFKVKDDENGYQDTKNESSSPNRRKYERENPSTSDRSARLFSQRTSRSSDLKTNNDQKSTFQNSW